MPMFEILKNATKKLTPYFVPSWDNALRTTGAIVAVFVVPLASLVLPLLLISGRSQQDNQPNDNNIVTVFTNSLALTLIAAAQQGLSVLIGVSTSQAIRKDHANLLFNDECHFLANGNFNNFTSLQYVTVGVGVKDFAANIVPVLALPVYILSSGSSLAYIGIATGSLATIGSVLGLVAVAGGTSYYLGKEFFSCRVDNQKNENMLVARINAVESNRQAIHAMSASRSEYDAVVKIINKIESTVPKQACLVAANTLVSALSVAIASQFIGGYDTWYNSNSAANTKVINVMILSLLSNVFNITIILTNNFSFIKLNLEQLMAYEEAVTNCKDAYKANNKAVHNLAGNNIVMKNVTVYEAEPDNINKKMLYNILDLTLQANKIYKLSAWTYKEKKAFLDLITRNGQYCTDGVITLPNYAENSIALLSEDTYIPIGKTLLEIICYPMQPSEFAETYFKTVDLQIAGREQVAQQVVIQDDPMLKLIDLVNNYLKKLALTPDYIQIDELKDQNIYWDERLTAVQKQEIGLLRCLLKNPKIIVMDKALSKLELEELILAYSLIKEYLKQVKDYIVIYNEDEGLAAEEANQEGDSSRFATHLLSRNNDGSMTPMACESKLKNATARVVHHLDPATGIEIVWEHDLEQKGNIEAGHHRRPHRDFRSYEAESSITIDDRRGTYSRQVSQQSDTQTASDRMAVYNRQLSHDTVGGQFLLSTKELLLR